jgi:SOS-response transcriptional repressor LexA
MTSLSESARDLIQANPALAEEVARQMSPRPAGGVTGRQRDVLEFIRAYHSKHGITPSYGEIMNGVGLASKAGVNRLVVALEERGFITRLPNRARSIALREGR